MSHRLVTTIMSLATFGCAAFACATTPEAFVIATRPDAAGAPSFAQEESKGDAEAAPVTTSMCTSSTCAAPYATCPDAQYLCGTNLDTDENNCGRCGNVCPRSDPAYPDTAWVRAELNTDRWGCIMGRCKMVCTWPTQFLDCNGYVEDGCETKIGTTDNCLRCGDECPPGFECNSDTGCYDPSCPPPNVLCGNECVNLESNGRHCGKCHYDCRIEEPLPSDTPPPPPNMYYGCSGRQCNQLSCGKPYANCNGNLDDGCEVNLDSDNDNCGSCGAKCDVGQRCAAGTCGCIDMCDCIDSFDDDPDNCGVCQNRCPGPTLSDFTAKAHGRRMCRGGRCGFACDKGYADCNHDVADGCEVNLQNDPQNCGACGNACIPGQACANAACATEPCSGSGVVQ